MNHDGWGFTREPLTDIGISECLGMGNFPNFRDFQGLIGKKIFREFPIQIVGNSRFRGQKWDFSVFVLYALS